MAFSQLRSYNILNLLLIGLVFHLVFILSVFDCYFTSPVVHGMRSFRVSTSHAKRLVLIVGDGLRADLLFQKNGFPSWDSEQPDIVAPYLRNIVEKRGAFGISNTRVPTESRPGHVSIIAGMYEDVSAVTKGWKTNPVDFDSIFNQSSTTFSFGSPDILPMFSRGAAPGKVMTWSYNEEDEDFTKDATALDIWVLDRLKELLVNSTTDSTLHSKLHAEGTVFFLHLLGLDTTGHSYRPHSLEYMHNIQVVDRIVQDTEGLLSQYYGDEETSYIFTADHGMSVIGNHGDGHPDNTRTPLVAWGKGIRGPAHDPTSSSHDAYSAPWALSHLLRRDVEQADIAALMATLLGISWPVNSVGILPDVHIGMPGYLDVPESDVAEASLVNVQMLLEAYTIQHVTKKKQTFFYKPFSPIEALGPTGLPRRLEILDSIQQLIDQREWTLARKESADFLQIILAAIRYVQTYERTLIRWMVTFAYTGWSSYASLYIFKPSSVSASPWVYFLPTGFAFCSVLCFWTVLYIQHSPWTYYLYILFPSFFWQQSLVYGLSPLMTWLSMRNFGKGLLRALLVLAALLGMVAGYTHRSLWSLGFLLMAFVWPVLTWSREVRQGMGVMTWLWPLSCVCTAIFPLLSVDKTESITAIIFGGTTILALGGAYYLFILRPQMAKQPRLYENLPVLFSAQAALLLSAMFVTVASARSLQAKAGLPFINQVGGWIIFVISSLLPFVGLVAGGLPEAQLLTYFLGLGTTFVILSISVEGLFYASFAALLACWISVEEAVSLRRSELQPHGRSLRADDMRIALFFLFFVQVGFFGTGNVASIASFYLAPVYRLIPVFNPFFMASLLMFKIIVPYIILAITFATLNHRLSLEPFSLFLVALAVMDVMTLTFFFNVTDTGSWLEIGQTISFFCITSLLLVWSAGICVAGEHIMKKSFVASSRLKEKSS